MKSDQQMPPNCLRYFLKSFHFLFELLASGRRNNGDACGARLPSRRSKAEELLREHRGKVLRQPDQRPGLQPGDTGEPEPPPEPRLRGSERRSEETRGPALGVRPEQADAAPVRGGSVGIRRC